MLSRKQVRHTFLFLTLPLATLASLSYLTIAKAQTITPDNSLGAESSVVTPNVQIKDIPSDRIDGGAIRGGNLFHSFQEFNINAGRGAYFSNPAGIANILTRVTGSNFSNIQGVLGVLGSANLFLINPNGILFGPNARLDVGGSFLGSTANSLIFKNGFEFSATNPQAPPLLTINIPIGLGFRNNPGKITNQSNQPTIVDNSGNPIGLTVPSGNSLALVGGDINLDNGRITVPGGRVELGGLAGVGTVGLDVSGNTFKLNFPNDSLLSNITLANDARVAVLGNVGGDIVVNANNFTATNGGRLVAGTEGVGNAGDITVNVNNFNISGVGQSGFGAGMGNQTTDGASGNAGNIFINSKSFNASSGASVRNRVLERSQGDGGNINITTGSLSLSDGALLNATTYGFGNAGNVSVRASGAVELVYGDIYSTVEAGGVGNSGTIDIKAATLSLKDGAQLQTSVRRESRNQPAGRGDAGDVTVDVTGPVTIAGVKNDFPSGIFSTVQTGATGNGGNITISSGSFSLSDGGRLSASTFGQGNAGNVSVRADNSVSLVNGGISSTVGSINNTSEQNSVIKGNGGNISITTGELSLSDSAQLVTITYGQGNAGDVIINANQRVILKGSTQSPDGDFIPTSVLATVGDIAYDPEGNSFVKGNSGNISITTGEFLLSDGAQLDASTNGRGNAGRVLVRASDLVSLTGSNTGIFSAVERTGVGDAGGININAPRVSLKDGAQITASSSGNGAAGDIEILARSIRLDNNSIIKADTVGGQGNINLNARDYVLLRRNSKITTNATGLATGGNIKINTGNLVAFPQENSDITAKAQESFGGRININANGIFGIEYRQQETPLSDITASSTLGPQFSGTVEINILNLDPSQGLFELIETVIDPAQQIAQHPCIKGFGSTFTITGRGGLPTDPKKILSGDNVRVDLVKPVASTVSSTSTTQKEASQKPPVKEIIPAQGWIFNEKGEVLLVGYDPTKTGPQRRQPAPSSSCAAVK
jgi:filamentous hemagglutinin family protein